VTAWRKATVAPTASTAGILRPEALGRHVEVRRSPPGPAVERWVENHWSLCWDLPEGASYPSQVLTHPTCFLTIEAGTHPRPDLPAGEHLVVTGVATKRFDVELRGWGRVVGVRFRPGGLAALTGRAASAWTDRTVSARGLLPDELYAALSEPHLAIAPEQFASEAEAALRSLPAVEDARYDTLLEIVTDMLADRSLLTVGEVARRHAVSLRSLQRLFTHYVGVGPKWVLARYRMHDAVSELDSGFLGTFTELAHRYGWYDQAHFTREFTALVGVTPAQYRDRVESGA
jgi:AraC-like DNA-binding protein